MSSTPQTPSTKVTGGDNSQTPESRQHQTTGVSERIAALLRKAADLKARVKAKVKAQRPAKCSLLLIAILSAILFFSSRPSNEEIRLYTSIHV